MRVTAYPPCDLTAPVHGYADAAKAEHVDLT